MFWHCSWSRYFSCPSERKRMCTSEKEIPHHRHSTAPLSRGLGAIVDPGPKESSSPGILPPHPCTRCCLLFASPPLIWKEPRFLNPHHEIREGIDSLSPLHLFLLFFLHLPLFCFPFPPTSLSPPPWDWGSSVTMGMHEAEAWLVGFVVMQQVGGAAHQIDCLFSEYRSLGLRLGSKWLHLMKEVLDIVQ